MNSKFDSTKRYAVGKVGAWLGILGVLNFRYAWGDMAEQEWIQEAREKMRRANEKHASDVERLYSTKPVRVALGGSTYLIPVNHITEKGADMADAIEAKDALSLVFFLPDFGGFTKDNWQEGWFDTRRIDVVQLSADNSHREPRANFERARRSLEQKPSLKAHGLQGYRWANPRIKGVHWTGTKPSGEFFLLETTEVPGQPAPRDSYPLCKAHYYDASERLFIAYHYSLNHIGKWREIDDGIWESIQSWRKDRRGWPKQISVIGRRAFMGQLTEGFAKL